MKKYVFESYSDKKGTGTLRLFDSKEAAVEYAKDELYTKIVEAETAEEAIELLDSYWSRRNRQHIF